MDGGRRSENKNPGVKVRQNESCEVEENKEDTDVEDIRDDSVKNGKCGFFCHRLNGQFL